MRRPRARDLRAISKPRTSGKGRADSAFDAAPLGSFTESWPNHVDTSTARGRASGSISRQDGKESAVPPRSRQSSPRGASWRNCNTPILLVVVTEPMIVLAWHARALYRAFSMMRAHRDRKQGRLEMPSPIVFRMQNAHGNHFLTPSIAHHDDGDATNDGRRELTSRQGFRPGYQGALSHGLVFPITADKCHLTFKLHPGTFFSGHPFLPKSTLIFSEQEGHARSRRFWFLVILAPPGGETHHPVVR